MLVSVGFANPVGPEVFLMSKDDVALLAVDSPAGLRVIVASTWNDAFSLAVVALVDILR